MLQRSISCFWTSNFVKIHRIGKSIENFLFLSICVRPYRCLTKSRRLQVRKSIIWKLAEQVLGQDIRILMKEPETLVPFLLLNLASMCVYRPPISKQVLELSSIFPDIILCLALIVHSSCVDSKTLLSITWEKYAVVVWWLRYWKIQRVNHTRRSCTYLRFEMPRETRECLVRYLFTLVSLLATCFPYLFQYKK